MSASLRNVRSMILLFTLACFLLAPSSVFADSVYSLGLEEEAVVCIDETRLDDMRGKYMGFFFTVEMCGFLDNLGNEYANLTIETNIDGDNVNVTTTEGDGGSLEIVGSNVTNGTEAKVTAGIGNLGDFSGVFQANQVPGSFNFVRNGITFNLWLFNIDETQMATLQDAIASLPMF